MNIEEKILSVMRQFVTIQRKELLNAVLCVGGNYTLAAEKEFDAALDALKRSGRVIGRDLHGWWRIAPTPAPEPAKPTRKEVRASPAR